MKKIKIIIENLGLSFKKEVFIILICIACGFLTTLFLAIFFDLLMVLIGIAILIVVIGVIFYRYWSLLEKQKNEREEEFIYVINYFEIFMSNGINVYNCFIEVQKYCSEWMRQKIEQFLNEIDKDKSVFPFVNFARQFKTAIYEDIMIFIFQMIDEGEDVNKLNRFDLLFHSHSENHQMKLVDKKRQKLDALSTFPLIGAALIVVFLSIGIILIMGEIIDVF